jgi:hypothetical protein
LGLVAVLLDAAHDLVTLSASDAAKLAGRLSEAAGLAVAPRSICGSDGTVYAVGRKRGERLLLVCWRRGRTSPRELRGGSFSAAIDGEELDCVVCPTTQANASVVRGRLGFLRPSVIGLAKSFGFGDRLGLATPGHVRSLGSRRIAPFFAQQSIREMTRSGRTAQAVMDDAAFGILEEGFHGVHGADADHLKTTDDADYCIAAGFTLYTVDPGDHVDDAADSEDAGRVAAKVAVLPWKDLETTLEDLRKRFLAKPISVGPTLRVSFTEETLMRAAAKYSRAALQAARIYRHIASRKASDAFELEVSVDETATPTSTAEHLFIATELRRLGVRWVSLAPRFAGRFEKGVDYIGDLSEFEKSFIRHAEIARSFGPYKLSIHSGSDKFGIYPAAAKHTAGLVHVKTAGTSYLEALRTIAGLSPGLFREILDFARGRYETDRKTYHVSADIAKVPASKTLKDAELAGLLEQFDARQVLHVTYGSVLTTEAAPGKPLFRTRLLDALATNPEEYARTLKTHFDRHLQPFA